MEVARGVAEALQRRTTFRNIVAARSKVVNNNTNTPLPRQTTDIFANADIHEAQAHALVYHVALLDPILQTQLPVASLLNLFQSGLLHHQELPDLDELLRRQSSLHDFPGFFQARRETVDDNHSFGCRMFVVMVVMVRRRYRLPEDIWMELAHMRFVAPDGTDVPPLLPAFRGRQIFCWEQRFGARSAAQYYVRLPYLLFQQSGVLPELTTEDTELRVRAPLVMIHRVEFLHQALRARE